MKICLIGSAKFEKEFIEANRELTLRGFTVHSLAVLPSQAGGKDWYTPVEKVILDLAHLSKIIHSEVVVLVGDGYFGFSTSREILWADMNGKTIVRATHPESWDSVARKIRDGSRWNMELTAGAKEVLKKAVKYKMDR